MSKKLYMFVSTFLLCVLLAGCGANMSASPNLGTWEAESASMSGVELAISDIMPGGFTFILNADGSCELNVNGQSKYLITHVYDSFRTTAITLNGEITKTLTGESKNGVETYFSETLLKGYKYMSPFRKYFSKFIS